LLHQLDCTSVIFCAFVGKFLTIKCQRSCGRCKQTEHHIGQRRFARPTFTDDGKAFALLYRKRYIAHSMNRSLGCFECLGKIGKF